MSRRSKAAWRRTPARSIVRRLRQSGISAETAQEWVRLWDAEAERRGLAPTMADWWPAAWEWIAEHRRLNDVRTGSGGRDPFDPVVTVESLHRAWERAEKRYRALPPDSPDAGEALDGVNQLWEAYEEALGVMLSRSAMRPAAPKGPVTPTGSLRTQA